MPQRPGKAMLFAALIWLIGFVWGSFVFMTPSLKATPPIPYVSTNPAYALLLMIPRMVGSMRAVARARA